MGGVHLLQTAADQLDAHPEALRIRKLLFGICYRRWENDPNTLQQVRLPNLLEHLTHQYPTAQAVEHALNAVVSKLNRQAHYEPLAIAIVQVLIPVFQPKPAPPRPATADATQFMAAPPSEVAPHAAFPDDVTALPPTGITSLPAEPDAPPRAAPTAMTQGGSTATMTFAPMPDAESESALEADSPDPSVTEDSALVVRAHYAEIARSLERHPESRRIRKLVYAVCFQTWENDMLVLESNAMVDLLEMLHTEYVSHSQITVALNQRAATLNRSVTYLQVAHAISEGLRSLYEMGLQPPAKTGRYEAEPHPSPTNALESELTGFPGNHAGQESTPLHEPTAMVNPLDSIPVPGGEETGLVNLDETGIEADFTIEPYPTAKPVPQADHLDRKNLFDLRIDIMRYTNPLRAKLILFTSLHRTFEFTPQDWRSLQRYTLDDLVRQLFSTYHTIDEVDVNLTRSAYALPNSDEQIPVLNTLLRAIAPYYPPS